MRWTLLWRPSAEKGEVTAVTTFHSHCVQQPFAWNANLSKIIIIIIIMNLKKKKNIEEEEEEEETFLKKMI